MAFGPLVTIAIFVLTSLLNAHGLLTISGPVAPMVWGNTIWGTPLPL
jgi:hypothetical protein